MPKTLEQAAEEIRSALPPLMAGYYVKPSEDGLSDMVLIGNADLAFAVTRAQIDDNIHIMMATKTFPILLQAIAQHHATISSETDLKMAADIVETYARV